MADLDALYEVCLRTGDAGEDAGAIYSDPRLLGDIYVGPYVVLDSGLGFTAVDEEGPGGYGLAAPDTRQFEQEAEQRWWPALRERYALPGSIPTPDDELVTLIHDPPQGSEEVVSEYPAHLHIDLLPRFRGIGLGRKMMDRLIYAVAGAGAQGVHLAVDRRNQRAVGFYQHLGFRRLVDVDDALVMGLRFQG